MMHAAAPSVALRVSAHAPPAAAPRRAGARSSCWRGSAAPQQLACRRFAAASPLLASRLQAHARCVRQPRPLRAAVTAAAVPPRNERLLEACAAVTNLFPFWVALGAGVGLLHPPAVTWFQGPAITSALAVTMLGMGLTMDTSDFLDVVPRQVALGVVLQFTIMPLLAFTLSRVLPLPTPLAVGLILVGCCPGGTASNLVTYIAGASVALSVVLTAASTLLASGATPTLCAALAGTLVPVPAAALMVSTAQVVLAPIALGVALKQAAPAAVAAAAPLCPPVAVATVALICASVIGGSAAAVRSAGPLLLAAVGLLHAGGFALGYAGAAATGNSERVRRTISIEVGMQNSALGCVLALAHFADPTTAVPAAVSATVHSVLGSTIAGVWRWRDARAAEAAGARLQPL